MSKMAGPTIPTVKRLFALSGNKCAFPKCRVALVDEQGTVVGKVCHICARNPGGSRYDPQQTDAERHAYENLILLCGVHHDVIDSDEDSYTVERLLKMKEAHEGAQTAVDEPSDQVAQQLLVNVRGNSLHHGSIIISNQQMGGQVAHSITNVGQQPRRIGKQAADDLIRELSQHPKFDFWVEFVSGDVEANALAFQFMEILQQAGWTALYWGQSSFHPEMPRGFQLVTPSVHPGITYFAQWLHRVGLSPKCVHDPTRENVWILVGVNP
jgi:hypothetical protein